jgi:D-alanyl-D-alanine dipeptidase
VDHFKQWSKVLTATEIKPYFYPDPEKSALFTNGYIASRSSHSCGAAVDLTIVDMKSGCDADMGGGLTFSGSCPIRSRPGA